MAREHHDANVPCLSADQANEALLCPRACRPAPTSQLQPQPLLSVTSEKHSVHTSLFAHDFRENRTIEPFQFTTIQRITGRRRIMPKEVSVHRTHTALCQYRPC